MFAGPTAERIRELGLVLSAEAVQALEGLPQDYAWELLEVVKSKVEGGHIKNPSNYVCATIARGYVPQADGGAVTASIGRAGGAPQGQSGVMVVPPRKRGFEHVPRAVVEREEEVEYLVEGDMDDATSRLAASRGMLKAQQVGLTLSDEAVKALLQLQPDHASELLESVADKHAMLRDPSNYIAATVSRGFVSKASSQQGMGAANDFPAPVPSHALRPAPSVAQPSGKTSLVPPDITSIEASVLELNAQDLWGGQQLSAETLVALRCVAEDQALGLLNSLEAKGRGKGAVNINNPNNYVQAALVKIKKGLAEHGPAARGAGAGPVPRNTTGNMSRQKAREMGLDLHDETLELLAKVPLKDANWLLEAAQWVSSQEEDPNEYIQSEAANMIEAMEEAAATKKHRWV